MKQRGCSAALGLAVCLCVWMAQGQTLINLQTQARQADFSAYTLTKPFRMGLDLPATCALGEVFFKNNATAGANLHVCSGTNSWTPVGAVQSVFGRSGGIVPQAGDYTFAQIAGTLAASQIASGEKQGSGTKLQMFGGGSAAGGDCAKFDANGNIVSAGGPCGVALGSSTYLVSFNGAASVTVPGTTHQLATKNLTTACYDSGLPPQGVDGFQRSVNGTSFDVTVTFPVAFNGYCVISAGGGGSSGQSSSGGSGDVSSVETSSTDGQMAAFSGTTGKQIKRLTSSGLVKLTSGVASVITGTATDCVHVDGSSGACSNADLSSAETSSTDGQMTLFNGTTGKQIKKFTSSGVVKVSGGVASVIAGNSSDCIRVDGTSGGCGGLTIATSSGLAGDGSAANPLSLDAATVPTYLTGTVSLAGWGSISAASCQEKSLTLAGAAAGDAVIPGWPDLPVGLSGTMRVAPAGGLVVISLCNATASALAVTDGLTFRATLIRGFGN